MPGAAGGAPSHRRPPELAAEVGGRTADDGSFVLRSVPLQGDIMVEVVAPGFGSPWVFWQLNKSVTIRLDRAGSVAGSLSGPAGAEIARVKVKHAPVEGLVAGRVQQ